MILKNWDFYSSFFNCILLLEIFKRSVNIKMEKEFVNHPQHYGGDTTYECIKVLKA